MKESDEQRRTRLVNNKKRVIDKRIKETSEGRKTRLEKYKKYSLERRQSERLKEKDIKLQNKREKGDLKKQMQNGENGSFNVPGE